MQIIPFEIEILPFLLEETIAALDGRYVDFNLDTAIRSAMRMPEKVSVSDCAEKYRMVTAVDAQPGPWQNDLVPHTVEPMNAYAEPWVKEVWLCWPERAAKTNVMLNCLAWTKLFDSGNAFWLDPAEDDSGKNVKTKIIPMFRESEKLRDCLSPRADDTGKGLIAFQDGTYLFPAHSNSARSMANFFGLHNFGNEVDKYPPMTGTETNPINLIRKRGRDVTRSKFMFSSTPAGRHIYKGTFACRQVKELYNKCPHCGELVLMDDEHLSYPQDATIEQLENGDVEIGYSCNACGIVWDEEDRRESYRHSRWICIKGEDAKRPRTKGYHASALCFPMIPLTEYCSKHLASKTGDLSDRIDYAHGYKVIDYDPALADRKEDYILRLCDDRPDSLVPTDIDALTMHVDTQDNGFWYTIRAWRFGEVLSSWLVRGGFVDTLAALELILYGDWYDIAHTPHRVNWAIIDTQGHRTAEIYLWCLKTGVIPAQGASGNPTRLVSVSSIDNFPGTNKPLPSPVRLHTFNTHKFKDDLASKLLTEPSDPGAWLLHSGITETQQKLHEQTGDKINRNLQNYAAHFCVESRDDRGLWSSPKGKPNHLWDCEVMALVLAHAVQMHKMRRGQAAGQQQGRKTRSTGVE